MQRALSALLLWIVLPLAVSSGDDTGSTLSSSLRGGSRQLQGCAQVDQACQGGGSNCCSGLTCSFVAFNLMKCTGSGSTPPPTCGKNDFQSECSSTSFCQNKYPGLNAFDCKNSEGGVCYCGSNNQVCGCLTPPATPSTTTTTTTTTQGTCDRWNHQSECTSTSQCRNMYAGKNPYDCKNSQGGVCYCGNNQVCGCL